MRVLLVAVALLCVAVAMAEDSGMGKRVASDAEASCMTVKCTPFTSCFQCMDGNVACLNSSRTATCCGCVNGACWSCPLSNQCSMSNPFKCGFRPPAPAPCGTGFCPPGTPCMQCMDGNLACMNATMGSTCCGCVNGACWSCPSSSMCNLAYPFNCTIAPPPMKTCMTTMCPSGLYCFDCLDRNVACLNSPYGTCCGCVNGQCWSCPQAYQCNSQYPNRCF